MNKIEEFPKEILEQVKEDIERFGEWQVSHLLHASASVGRIVKNLDQNHFDSYWHHVSGYLIGYYATVDPTPFHFVIAREILASENIENSDEKLVDVLARELVGYCNKFKEISIKEQLSNQKISNSEKLLAKFEMEGVNSLDKCFIDFIKPIGNEGKKQSDELLENSRKRYSDYKKSNYSAENRPFAWSLWISTDKSILSYYLKILCHVIWRDVCKVRLRREIEGCPSVAKPIIDRIIPILDGKEKKRFIEKEGNIICCNQRGEPLLMAPAIDANMIIEFQKGVRELGTLTGHKLLRWQVNAGFERWAQGSSDARLIEIDGGYSRIAELIGCCNQREIARIKEILHVQAHGRFILSDGSHGNMISLRIVEKYRNQEPSKINIVLGEMLLPAYVCQVQKSERRLIPIGDLPPLHGSRNTYAGQAQLQLHFFSEFSEQSVRLKEKGSVLIPNEKLKQMAVKSGLCPDHVELIVDYWCQPDFFNCFLEKQGDEYKLATYHERAQKFLMIQGENRINNSQRGKRSVERKASRKGKGYHTH